MAVTADEVLRAAHARAAPLTGETAGYLVLGAADGLAGTAGALDTGAVSLTEDGSVRVGRVDTAGGDTLEADLRALLGRLLAHAPPGVPALVRVSRATEARGLERLVSELEAALIPVNRSAARRALARLSRDVGRAFAAGRVPDPVESAPPVSAPVVVAEKSAAAPPMAKAIASPAIDAPLAAEMATPVAATPPADIPPPPLVVFTPRPAPYVFGPGATPVVSEAAEAAIAVATPMVPPAVLHAGVEDAMAVVAAPTVGLGAAVIEPERTPFLGAWPGVAPVVTALRPAPTPVRAYEEVPEHDTEHAPPVVFDDDLPLVVEFEAEAEAGAQVEAEAEAGAEVEAEAGAEVEAEAGAEVEAEAEAGAEVEAEAGVRLEAEADPGADAEAPDALTPTPDEEAAWMAALFGPRTDDLSDAPTPEAWAREGDVMPDEPIAFGGSLDESARPPESRLRLPRLPESMELTAPWPPAVDPTPAPAVASPSTAPRSTPFFVFDDDDAIPPSEEYATATREGDAGIEVEFLPHLARASRASDHDVSDALEPLVQAASDAFVSAAGEKEAAAVAASEREALYLEADPVFAPVKVVVAPYQPRQSDVQQLIAGFGDGESASLDGLTRELQRFAGIGGTPDPGAVAARPRKANPSR